MTPRSKPITIRIHLDGAARTQAALDLSAATGIGVDRALLLLDRAAAVPMTTTARELLELTLEEAMARKWVEGRAKLGPEWQGDLPVIEAYSEIVDARNYLHEQMERDPHARAISRLVGHLSITAMALRVMCQEVAARTPEKREEDRASTDPARNSRSE